MVQKIIRAVISILGVSLGVAVSQLLMPFAIHADLPKKMGMETHTLEVLFAIVSGIIFGFIFFKLSPVFRKAGRNVTGSIEKELIGVPATDVMASTVGLIIGLVIAYFLSKIYVGLVPSLVGLILNIVSYVLLGLLGLSIGSRMRKDVNLQNFVAAGRAGDSKARKKTSDAAPKILDTSVIIDGRILDIMKTGFIEGNIVIPEFVLVELRHIADSSDSLKRNRGRRGLDVLNKIQSDYGIEIYNTDKEKALEEIPEVDVKLLKLAQIMNGKVVTNDFNLNKVAVIQEVPVLNINELANTLKPVVLPGEDMEVFLVKEGKENNQAVAYLDDGTMIVVEDGRREIGKTVDIIVTSVLQTSAGRMIFGKIKRNGRR